MKRYVFFSVVIFFSLVTGYHILWLWRGMVLSQTGDTKETLLQAARTDPSNPDSFHKLGVLHEWDFLQLDLKESAEYFQKAIERNPLEQEYWLSLARIFSRLGKSNAFDHALENAILVFPTSYRGRWVAGNLLLQQEDLEKAIPHFSYILLHYPNRSTLVYEIWRKAVDDPDFILERLIPEAPALLKQYLAYAYGSGDRESARKAWAKLGYLDYQPDRRETIRHVDFLISYGQVTEASHIWEARLRKEGLPVPFETNPVTNGGFEKEEVLGGGFDWRIHTVSGAQVSFDHSVVFEGESSLKIAFNGQENVDFHHVHQLVPLKPDTDYLLTAHVKTEAVTTKSGLRLEILGLGYALHETSDSLSGDNSWTELTVSFRTPPYSQGAVVRVRREKTDKFDRFISGTVWLDNVRIREVSK
jgi:hypothetical protein